MLLSSEGGGVNVGVVLFVQLKKNRLGCTRAFQTLFTDL